MSVAIITDSNSGITQSQAREIGIAVVPMPFYINDEVYYEDITMSQEEFYGYLKQDVDVKTSQPTPENLFKYWDEALETHDEVVYIPMSSGLSSSTHTAMLLAEDDKYKGKVFVVDNQRISVSQRQASLDAFELAKKGFDGTQIKDIMLRDKMESSIYIMLDTLYYLKKGGRITPAAAAIGTLLKIKPVLQIQGEKLDAYTKAKTLKSGKLAMIKAVKKDMAERFGDPTGGNCHLAIAHTSSPEDVEQFRAEVNEEFQDHFLQIDPLSLSVACHIGPGSLALAVTKKTEELL